MARQVAGSARRPNTSGTTLPQYEMILLSLAHAANWTTDRVPYEELVLQAWRDFPSSFSLRNHPEHPDGSDVHKRIYQSLKPAGLVVAIGNKMFRLTEPGIDRARLLESSEKPKEASAGSAGRLGREEQNFLREAVNSRPFATWRAGQGAHLVDYDARMFFQFSTSTPVDERKRRVQFALQALENASVVGLPEAQQLLQLAHSLAERFSQLWGGKNDAA